MSVEENKAIVGRWFTEFWGAEFNPAVIDELAAPDIRVAYSLHAPCRGREQVHAFATKFRAAFPDLGFEGTAELIGEGDYVSVSGSAGEPRPARRSTTCRSGRCRPVPARRCVSPASPC